jgi:hypothetical protein
METQDVQLYKARSWESDRYGVTQIDRSFCVKAKALPNAVVYISHEKKDGQWEDIRATDYDSFNEYGTDYQLWKGEIHWLSSKEISYDWAYNFSVKLDKSGSIIVDNNHGQNYRMENHSGALLGNNFNVTLSGGNLNYISFTQKTTFSGSIDVKNLAYNKRVFVVYSFDKWHSQQTVEAHFGDTYSLGYGGAISAPNCHGVEPWYFTVEVERSDIKEVDFAVGFEIINGNTFWDNNFGRNFHLKLNF